MSLDDLLSSGAFAANRHYQTPVAFPVTSHASSPLAARAQFLLRRGNRRSVYVEDGIRRDLLTPTPGPTSLFMEVTYPPGSVHAAELMPLRHRGREYGVLLEGQLAIEVDGSRLTLGAGDSVAFDSHLPHRVFNIGDAEARAVWFLISPSVDNP